jgi:5'(3')-deoxyribonucleotidase
VRIALDSDGVITDCATAVHQAAERILGRKLPTCDYWHSYSFAESMLLNAHDAERMYSQLLREDTLSYRVHLYPGAKDFVNALQAQGHEVFVLTAPWSGMKSWVNAREELLSMAFPGVDVVFAHAKHRAVFDLLIDDRLETVVPLADRAWLYKRPWNHAGKDDPRITRVTDYEEVLALTAQESGVFE